MLLKTPPPYGGGEIRGAALAQFVQDIADFAVQKICSPKRDKTSQGVFALWKIPEFVLTYWHFWRLVCRKRPRLIFHPLSKGFRAFLRDSVFFWTAYLLRIPFSGELGGARFYFMGNGTIETWYGKTVLSRFACLRVLGKEIAGELLEYGIKNTIVTDNGVEACPVAEIRKSFWKNGQINIVFVGTHSRQKGFDQLVKASGILSRRNRIFTVHVMGEWISDEFREKMLSELNKNRLEKQFVFHGLVHGRQKWAVMSRSHILVLPSMIEGQPLVILEALACGLPIVCSRVGAVPDTVEDNKNGYLIRPGDYVELAEKLDKLMTNRGLLESMSKENTRLYEKRFRQDIYLQTQVKWLNACAEGNLIPNGQFIGPD